MRHDASRHSGSLRLAIEGCTDIMTHLNYVYTNNGMRCHRRIRKYVFFFCTFRASFASSPLVVPSLPSCSWHHCLQMLLEVFMQSQHLIQKCMNRVVAIVQTCSGFLEDLVHCIRLTLWCLFLIRRCLLLRQGKLRPDALTRHLMMKAVTSSTCPAAAAECSDVHPSA
jgi:hypothetical protein